MDQEQKTKLEETVKSLGLTVDAVFIPFSQSHNKANQYPSLNWHILLRKAGAVILTTDYSGGQAHCPAYKASVRQLGGSKSVMRQEAIAFECENGRAAHVMEGMGITMKGKELKPDTLDVLYSLVMDSDALEYATYEDWASSLGYDADSRKGEQIYRACLDIALKLRAAIGDKGLTALREAFQDY